MTLFVKFKNLMQTLQTAREVKTDYFEAQFSFSLFFLFLGFVSGNLFGTFLTFFRAYIIWDGFIMMLGLVLVEFLNYVSFTHLNGQRKTTRRRLNFLKIGLLLGFFIDAFKVGS